MHARALMLAAALAASVLAGSGPAHSAAVAQACPDDVPAAPFTDVSADNVHVAAIDCVVDWELARGAGGTRYDPAVAVTRGQLATFVAKLVRRSGGDLPASPGDRFAGDDHSAHHYNINRLAAARVVAGQSGRFAPDELVTRGQAATFLAQGYERRTGQRLPSGRDAFGDDEGSVHETNIDKLAAAGFAVGVGEGRFAPADPVRRDQLATMLSRVLQGVVATGQVAESPQTLRASSELRSDQTCERLLGHLKERGLEEVGAYGWSGGFRSGPVAAPAPATPESGDGSGGSGGGPAGSPPYSGTNNQESGVDEADVVKTDGQVLWSIVDGRLRAVDVSTGTPRLAGALALPGGGYGGELLVSGSRALVLTSAYDSGEMSRASHVPGSGPVSVLTWVDLSDPAAMRVDGVLRLAGRTLAGRMVDGVAHVAVRAEPPPLGFTYPTDGSQEAYAEAERHNRVVVENSVIEDWLPRYRFENRTAAQPVTIEGELYGCDGLRRPPQYSGLGALSVLTVDLSAPPHVAPASGVLAGGELVYASARSLYVATSRWGAWTAQAAGADATTEIHRFSLTDPGPAVYRASGKVGGYLLNQFAMSELDGNLRVASTSRPPWSAPEAEPPQSSVTVLAERDGALTTIGQVGGLGRGETIHAVRFLGDTAYVVTFRQIDPLYTVDLRDPTAPRVAGELKIRGYSAYLHPIAPGLLLGVGQDATDEGQRLGAQLSLFDVSDPAAPQRLAQHALGDGSSSEVDFDHRAFLYWPPTRTAVLPISRYRYDAERRVEDAFLGAVGIEVDPDTGLQKVGEVTHGDPPRGVEGEDRTWPGIRRSVAVGDQLYTVSERGVMATDLSTFAEQGWAAFPTA